MQRCVFLSGLCNIRSAFSPTSVPDIRVGTLRSSGAIGGQNITVLVSVGICNNDMLSGFKEIQFETFNHTARWHLFSHIVRFEFRINFYLTINQKLNLCLQFTKWNIVLNVHVIYVVIIF